MRTETGLDARTGALVQLSAALACRNVESRRVALEAVAAHANRSEVEEVLLQAHLFVGFPAVLNAFIEWRRMTGSEAGMEQVPADRAGDGEALCRAVYGDVYERLREHVRRLHPDLDVWMVEHGYGRTLARPGLPVETRELCIVGLLAAAGHERQLRAHLHGALNVGAPAWRVKAALGVGVRASAGPAASVGADAARMLAIWEEVTDRAEQDSGRNPGRKVEGESCSSM